MNAHSSEYTVKKNMAKFKIMLSTISWDGFYQTNDPNQALSEFYQKYNDAHNECFPLKRQSIKRSKDKKWITSALKTSIRHKDKLFMRYTSKPSSRNKTKYCKYRNKLTNLIRKSEALYFRDLINSERQNLYTLWKIFGSVINPKKIKTKNFISELMHNNTKITDKTDISNTFNNHFSTVGQKLADKIATNNDHYKYLKNPNLHSIFLSPTEKNEVLLEIRKLNPKKSGGNDNVTPKLLQYNQEVLSDQITYIINLSFSNSIVPDQLKIAKVIPIHKKNERNNVENYRPISLLSTINKIMEKLMFKRVIKFLTIHNILYDYQFGFRENHSTSLALIEITDNILEDLQSGKYVAGIYLDLSKAFDTVDHKILLHKLYHYGIRGNALDWFTSYLLNRQQFTYVNHTPSSVQSVNYGVPQGSVLGPLLFLIYTNDIVNSVKNDVKIRLFADDTNVFISTQSPLELKTVMTQVLHDLFQWFKENKLTVNLDKTCFTVFKSKNKKIPEYLNSIQIQNTIIRKVSSAKYLGVILDENLDWKEHISTLNKSLIKTSNSFKIIKHQVPQMNKFIFYYAYIYSKIQYGIEVYGRAASTVLKKVQTQQNRALKILFDREFLTPTLSLHKDLNILLVQDIFKLYTLKFVYKQQNKLLPAIFDTYYTTNQEIHLYNTRQKRKLHIPKTTNKSGQNTIKNLGTTFWNQVPVQITQYKSVKGFNKKVKQHLISLY
jgi:hypothetical protein